MNARLRQRGWSLHYPLVLLAVAGPLGCWLPTPDRAPRDPGPQLEPGVYSFYPDAPPGCVEDPPAAEIVHLDRLTPIRRTVLRRSGRYEQVTVEGQEGFIASSHPDDARLLTVLSSDEPDVDCLEAEVRDLGEDRWFARTARWQSVLNLTTSRVHRLGTVEVLTRCRVEGAGVSCQGPEGPLRFDRDGVVVEGQYKPTWSADLDP